MDKLSIILPCSGGTRSQQENLMAVIKSLSNQSFRNFEFILVEQLMEDDYLYKDIEIDGIECKHVELPRQDLNRFYNLNWNRNAGHNVAAGDRFIFIECDIIYDSKYLQAISLMDTKWFVGWTQLFHLNKDESVLVRDMDDLSSLKKGETGCGTSPFGDAGKVICMTRDFFYNVVGGFNENMLGWGGNDNEMACRAMPVIGKYATMEYRLFHLWHPRGDGTDYDQHPTHNIWRIANDYPAKVSERIVEAKVGKLTGPTYVKLDDLGWK